MEWSMSVSGSAEDLSGAAPDDPFLVELVAEVADRIQGGGAVDLEKLVRQQVGRRHPYVFEAKTKVRRAFCHRSFSALAQHSRLFC